MRVVIFEGLDGAGKTTLFKAFEKSNDHYYACFDRWPPISSYVYDKFLLRYQNDSFREEYLSELTRVVSIHFKMLVVHVDTAPSICWERRKDEESYTLEDYVMQDFYYHEVMQALQVWGIPTMQLDGNLPVEILVASVTKKLQALEEKED